MNDHPAPTLEAVADEAILAETTIQPAEAANATFERRFAAPDRNPFFGWNPPAHPIHHYLVSDVVLDGQFRCLFKAGRYVAGTGYLLPDELLTGLRPGEAKPGWAEEDGVAIVGCNLGHANYFHWVTQALPAIDFAMRREGQHRRTVLVLPKLNAWQEELLRILGYAQAKRIVIDQPQAAYAFPHVEFSQYLVGEASFWQSRHARHTYAQLRESAVISLSESRKLYVARTDAPGRPLRNEAALIDALGQRGFEIVTPGSLSFTEQIRLFRNAAVVVGPHGAGMTNIVFCDPGAIVYELVPAHYTNACFCNLAHICGLHYWADKFGDDAAWDPEKREWEVDVAAVLRRVDEIDAARVDHLEAAQQRTISAMDFLRGRPGSVAPAQPEALPPAAKRGLLQRLFGRGG